MEARTTYWVEIEVNHKGPLNLNELAVVLENQLNGTDYEFVRVTGATTNPEAGKDESELATYNPSTHVVVSRDAAKAASETIERCLGDGFREYFDLDELDSVNNALAELRAALEGER